jgi:hypothetical protein
VPLTQELPKQIFSDLFPGEFMRIDYISFLGLDMDFLCT